MSQQDQEKFTELINTKNSKNVDLMQAIGIIFYNIIEIQNDTR